MQLFYTKFRINHQYRQTFYLIGKKLKIIGHFFMKKHFIVRTIILTAAICGLFSTILFAQTKELRATKFEIKKTEGSTYSGELYITVDGKEKKIADSAIEAWLISGGKDVVFSGSDGSGGFENEGQSLRIYNVQYDQTRKILSEYVGIDAVAEKKLSNGKTALLVRMSDGGLGASYFAVVDPLRGEIFYRQFAEVIKITGDFITLGFYKEDDWEKIGQQRDWRNPNKTAAIPKPTKVRSYKTERHNLKTIVENNEVIYNKPSYDEDYYSEDKTLREVKIYLWRANDEFQNRNFVLSPVPRRVKSAAPLQPTLEALFRGATENEEENGFSSATFGMKFEGVVLTNGTALVKFSQPPNETNYGSLGPFIFFEAIEKTAKQFPTVKKVEICAVGETLIDSQLDEQIPRCPK